MKTIPLTQGYEALVDDEDYEWLSQWRWQAHVRPHTTYAVRHSAGRHETRRIIRMHREILGTTPSMKTDHVNGEGLDNRRANLRACSAQQNARNSRSRLGSSSDYLGVCWHKYRQKWGAEIRVDGITRFLGYFRVEAEAGSAYKAAAAIVHGEFAAGARGDRL